ncbi:hypothetical protein BD410DRAFT_834340 [Rickenella mellea]|uniref:Zn(2)-C6 fungal-type domain-containing protein n=1 Tax=Rickenella mellea TaxID=50990 RepID=A0A4R5XG40_9AGAM|nr:hypothetical protein BD410DRAFT_834340 [Rickenella mellea]
MSRQGSFEPQGQLQRGRACLSCRRRKMRCDGVKPLCGPCMYFDRPEECEWTDQGRAFTEILEEEVSRLEDRVQELENPGSSSASVKLHDPHAVYYEAQTRRSGSSTPSVGGSPDYSIQIAGLSDILQHMKKPSATNEVEFDASTVLMLVSTVIKYSKQLGFALNVDRFLSLIRLPKSNPSYPHPAVLNSIYIWAFKILKIENVRDLEPVYLEKARLSLTEALSNNDFRIRMQAVQAEILLALYFFNSGRTVEGQYHASGASNLAIGMGLHQIRPLSRSTPSRSRGSLGDTTIAFSIPPVRSAPEEAERIGLFWAVFNLDKCWSAANGSPPIMTEDGNPRTQIDTPWPSSDKEVNDRGSRTSPVDNSTGRTVQDFLSGRSSRTSDMRRSTPALRSQVSAILDCVHRTARGGQTQSTTQSDRAYSGLSRCISSFIDSLPSLDELAQLPAITRITHWVILSLAHAATIRLNVPRVASEYNANIKCHASARAIIGVMERVAASRPEFIDPIIVMAWMTASRVITRDSSNAFRPEAKKMRAALSDIVKACPVLEYQISKVQAILPTH